MPERPPLHRPPWQRPRAQAERERKARLDAQRPPSTKRGYDTAWRKLRAQYLEAYPYCQRVGCSAMAVDVDHIKPIATHPHLRLEWSNLRSLCRSHHSQRTALEQGFARGGRGRQGRG